MRRERLPFTSGDWTAGSESELQVAVIGEATRVDLPETIRASAFIEDLRQRHRDPDHKSRRRTRSIEWLEGYLEGGRDGIWENSWVRFREADLSVFTRRIVANDLLADQQDPGKGVEERLRAVLLHPRGGAMDAGSNQLPPQALPWRKRSRLCQASRARCGRPRCGCWAIF